MAAYRSWVAEGNSDARAQAKCKRLTKHTLAELGELCDDYLSRLEASLEGLAGATAGAFSAARQTFVAREVDFSPTVFMDALGNAYDAARALSFDGDGPATVLRKSIFTACLPFGDMTRSFMKEQRGVTINVSGLEKALWYMFLPAAAKSRIIDNIAKALAAKAVAAGRKRAAPAPGGGGDGDGIGDDAKPWGSLDRAAKRRRAFNRSLCHNCGRKGHKSAACPAKGGGAAAGSGAAGAGAAGAAGSASG
jgi:hypothetical protein